MRKNLAGIGELTEEIELAHRELTADGGGGYTATWTKYADEWAKVQPMTGGERFEAMRTEALSMYVVTFRNRDDVLESDSITWGGRNLNIRFVRARGPRDLYVQVEAELGARK